MTDIVKKYELVESDVEGMFRVKALVDIPSIGVKVGDLGGLIESESNLSLFGEAWVGGDARVYGKAHVFGKAHVYGNARIYGNSYVYGNARVYGDTHVCGYAHIHDNARIYDKARVAGDAHVHGNAVVHGEVYVYGLDQLSGTVRVFSSTQVFTTPSAISSGRHTTAVKNLDDNSVTVITGCFIGNIKQFKEAIEKTHGDSEAGDQYRKFVKMIEMYFDM